MGVQEVHLEPVTWGNIDQIIEAGTTDNTPFQELPRTEAEAEKLLSMLAHMRVQGDVGDVFAAYDNPDADRLVGGGSAVLILGRLTMGYWVTAEHQGYDHAIARGLLGYATEAFPRRRVIEAHVHPLDLASRAVYRALSFELTDRQTEHSKAIYRRRSLRV